MLYPALLERSVKKERKQDCTHVDHNQLDLLCHLESYVHTNIVLVLKSRYVWATTNKQHNIGVYDFK